MGFIEYKDSLLYCEDVALQELAEEYGTPLYVYSKQEILNTYRTMHASFGSTEHCICYSVKANNNPTLLRLLAEEGAGAEVGSAGELYLALKAGFSPEQIIFTGVGKREDEIEFALTRNIFMLNVESVQELQTISRIALRLNTTARIALRVKFMIDSQTPFPSTSNTSSSKFGIDETLIAEVFRQAQQLPALEPIGLHIHLGTQITSTVPYRESAQRVSALVQEIRAMGVPLQYIDFGGGFGVPYHNVLFHEALPVEPNAPDVPPLTDFIDAFLPYLQQTGCTLWIEPGRSITANAGILLTKVLYIKDSGSKKYIVIDSGMTDFLRPILYNAYHQIVPLNIQSYEHITADIVGPVNDNNDAIAHDRALPKVHVGDYLAIATVGAYGFVYASNYNGRLHPAEVLVNGERVRVIRSRQTFEELI
ncbi:MAG: diaminopimelate decarboxylase [Bacteroidetes bacterium]|nr:diaminopimelate decarboxylase [Bacteroidota bacterium]